MRNIVIVGGSFAGLGIGHYLLRHVVPRLNSTSTNAYKVTIISPSDRSFYKIASPRVLVKSDIISADTAFYSIPDGFSEYNSSDFTFLHGVAVALDESTKAISVKLASSNETTFVTYDTLVIATGTTSKSPLWTLHGDWHVTKDALQEVNTRLSTAKSILIAGGGAVGNETAGEIAFSYHPKDLTLLSGDAQLLNRLNNKGVGKAAEKKLIQNGTKVVHNLRVTASAPAAGNKAKTTVTLSDGTTRTVDLYIDCTGGMPNTDFLPKAWLDANSRVSTDSTTLRATGAPKGVYAIGDVASYSKMNVMDAVYAVPALGYSIYADLSAAATTTTKSAAALPLKEKKFKQIESDVMFAPIGPKSGVGVAFGWRIPGFLVWLIKSRTFFLEKSPEAAKGVGFEKP
jgi:NADH dehydrogenase FAD-containing subunit